MRQPLRMNMQQNTGRVPVLIPSPRKSKWDSAFFEFCLPGGAATIVMGGEYQGTIFTSEMVETKTPVAMAVTMTPLTQAPMARGMIMQ